MPILHGRTALTRAAIILPILCILSIVLLAFETHSRSASASVAEIIPNAWRRTQYSLSNLRSHSTCPKYNHYDAYPARLGTLGVASRIFVISLPHRSDRRLQMGRLGSVLGLDFTYVDALYLKSPLVQSIMDNVRELRIGYGIPLNENNTQASTPTNIGNSNFVWPEDIETVAHSFGPLGKEGSDLWEDKLSSRTVSLFQPIIGQELVPLTNAYKNISVEPYGPLTPEFRILTAGRIACWYSHLKVIRQIAEGITNEVSVVLEDDVDMEIDIRQRLLGLWDALPAGWDILFLGHCWSDESRHPALKVYNSSLSGSTFSLTALHPSLSPKCTHGYALTTRGARRIAMYLRYPPFAYSRAIDQAIAWLVKSGKLKSYSLVPSVVVQRKADESDIVGGIGSGWKDNLSRGVFL